VAAIQRGDTPAVKSALASGENPNCSVPSEFGDSPLTVALQNQRAEVVEMLVQAGAKWDFLDGKPVALAAAIEDSTALEALLGSGANPNVFLDRAAPLCMAVHLRLRRSVTLLLEHGADPNVKCADEQGNPPVLMTALRTADANLIASLLRSGADVNARDDERRSALDVAKGRPELLKLLSGGTAAGARESPPVPPLPPDLKPPARRPVRVGTSIAAPKKLFDVQPIYPPIAESARVEGDVAVEIVIGDDGSVQGAKVVRSIPLLDAAALAAVRQWQYARTRVDGVAVPVVMTVQVPFRLQNKH